MDQLVFALHVFSTLAMAGLIWFVQVVHYPLFASVGTEEFTAYERAHQVRTTWVVAPLMITEALTAFVLLWIRPEGIAVSFCVLGVALTLLLWASTFFWQVPAHERLQQSFDPATHAALVKSNWVRTVGWSARGVLVCAMAYQAQNHAS